jgi:hypothetical protein
MSNLSTYDGSSNLPTSTGNSLPGNTPAEALDISPESLEVANCYLQTPSIAAVADSLGIQPELVATILKRREVKAYVDSVFYNLGFNNRFQMSEAMDLIIQKKFKEMDEADVGSNKDITEILALKHKMIKDHMDHELAIEKIRASAGVKTQVNIQQNNSGGSRYASLIEQLMTPVIDASDD